MTHHEFSNRLFTLSACALATALCFVSTVTFAQTIKASPSQGDASAATSAIDAAQPRQESAAHPTKETQAVAEEEDTFDLPLQVGDSTLNLFAWQRSGEIASKTPRPIAGSVASRSYERYLKSFEHPIPERLGSSVTNAKNGGGASSTGSR
ncbi:hypothetical protein J2W25_006786 [Variovorax boronicumulans]|uniref:DUF3613 domain-containing protein n=1 Tax=Variovorax boronicumulans TaxID=436515 RepID=A0AAW8E836_9BURK|nr:DUF3613 domain-containing protein [Variovorax boronicumulans]MDP9882420.1 hypothetical protein [Variovorax boronicumulans]MDP9927732.1 hypothetical protein [Variovorax boronicumulans]